MIIYRLYVLFCYSFLFCSGDTVSDKSGNVFGSSAHYFLAAFGDFNADKHTDIFVINKTDNQLDVLLAQEKPKDRFSHVHLLSHFHPITGVIPGDFDGDLQMDVMVLSKEPEETEVMLSVYWGNNNLVQVDPIPYNSTETLKDDPFILDWDGDMVADMMVETTSGKKFIWKLLNRTFTQIDKLSIFKSNWRSPHSHAFSDWTSDWCADIILSVEEGFEIWEIKSTPINSKNISLPEAPSGDKWKVIGQATIVDFDQDTRLDLLLPVCQDKECQESFIYLYSQKTEKWEVLDGTAAFSKGDDKYGFVPSDTNLASQVAGQQLPIKLRTGDFDMDGYLDVLTILRPSGSKTSQTAVLMLNRETSKQRKLETQWHYPFTSDERAMLPTFFDLFEDGLQDVLLTTSSADANPYSILEAWANKFAADACFIKITVVSHKCYSHSSCPGDRDPYGINIPGPTVTYYTTETDGSEQKSTGTQLSQAAHFALQLPYNIFGLGQTPNFVERLTVGIPVNNQTHADFLQVIPNSQLVVMPHPKDEPKKWKIQLYITPSQAIYITGASLAGTCLLVAVVVGLLHWREKVEDKKEKEQEAHKFHFDAM